MGAIGGDVEMEDVTIAAEGLVPGVTGSGGAGGSGQRVTVQEVGGRTVQMQAQEGQGMQDQAPPGPAIRRGGLPKQTPWPKRPAQSKGRMVDDGDDDDGDEDEDAQGEVDEDDEGEWEGIQEISGSQQGVETDDEEGGAAGDDEDEGGKRGEHHKNVEDPEHERKYGKDEETDDGEESDAGEMNEEPEERDGGEEDEGSGDDYVEGQDDDEMEVDGVVKKRKTPQRDSGELELEEDPERGPSKKRKVTEEAIESEANIEEANDNIDRTTQGTGNEVTYVVPCKRCKGAGRACYAEYSKEARGRYPVACRWCQKVKQPCEKSIRRKRKGQKKTLKKEDVQPAFSESAEVESGVQGTAREKIVTRAGLAVGTTTAESAGSSRPDKGKGRAIGERVPSGEYLSSPIYNTRGELMAVLTPDEIRAREEAARVAREAQIQDAREAVVREREARPKLTVKLNFGKVKGTASATDKGAEAEKKPGEGMGTPGPLEDLRGRISRSESRMSTRSQTVAAGPVRISILLPFSFVLLLNAYFFRLPLATLVGKTWLVPTGGSPHHIRTRAS